METRGMINRRFANAPTKDKRKAETINTLRDNEGSGNLWEHSWRKLDVTTQGEAKLNTANTGRDTVTIKQETLKRRLKTHNLTQQWG